MKIILAILLSVALTPAITFGKSRLDRVDCGPLMSRLDAGKCEKIKQAKLKARTPKEDNSSYSNPGTIKGEWDSKGRHYTPAGGNNLWRSDGTFMQKAAGGYIDTRTGQFIPSN